MTLVKISAHTQMKVREEEVMAGKAQFMLSFFRIVQCRSSTHSMKTYLLVAQMKINLLVA